MSPAYSMLRFATTLAIALTGGVTAAQPAPELPPLADPPTGIHLPGKFVWADLVTTRIDEAIEFYTTMFPLEWQQLGDDPERYGLFLHDGYPVAGLARHDPPDGAADYGRWVHFLSVDDVDAALDSLIERGGRTVMASRSVADRGRFAIAAGPDGELIGLIRSSSGDPDDYRAERGEWLWRELFSPDPAAAATTYEAVCRCTAVESEAARQSFVLISQDFLRAGISHLDAGAGDAPVWLGFVIVEDVNEATQRAQRLGANVRVAPQPDVMNGHVSVIIDPVGAALALVSWDYEAAD